jgi:(E)-4-hydroxy-3-methylbut-2-enyl-diphosphate synthase
VSTGGISADTAKAAEAEAWLRKIEDENAGELTPERIAQMEADGTAAPAIPVSGRRFTRARS